MESPDLYHLPLAELFKIAEKQLRLARRNVGTAWRLIEEAQLQLAKSK